MAELAHRGLRTWTQVCLILKQEQRAAWPQKTENVNTCLGLWGKVSQNCWTDFWRYSFEVYFQGENEKGRFPGENTAWVQMERNENAWQAQQPKGDLIPGRGYWGRDVHGCHHKSIYGHHWHAGSHWGFAISDLNEIKDWKITCLMKSWSVVYL